jgi:hypothetical protein
MMSVAASPFFTLPTRAALARARAQALVGRVGARKRAGMGTVLSQPLSPTPNPSPQGGGEHIATRG